jgi:hypothetical protein
MKMSKRDRTRYLGAILLVDATQEEVLQLRKEMPGWLWFAEDWPFDWDPNPSGQSIDAIIVFARKDREKRALDVCMHLCEKQEMETVPLFIAGSRYQMSLAHEVKRLPRGDFIFTPIDENALLDRIRAEAGVIS